MAVQVKEIVRDNICFYNEEGKDIRLSAPGVRWADLRTIRKGILESLRNSCQEAFDKIYEQVLDGRRWEEMDTSPTEISKHLYTP